MTDQGPTTGDSENRVVVGRIEVRGVDVDEETRCAHYGTERDVLAIEFACCGTFYSCYQCHDALAEHDAEVWHPAAFDEPALLCGVCGETTAIEQYLDSPLACVACGVTFNSGCLDHHDRYFDV